MPEAKVCRVWNLLWYDDQVMIAVHILTGCPCNICRSGLSSQMIKISCPTESCPGDCIQLRMLGCSPRHLAETTQRACVEAYTRASGGLIMQ